MFAAAVGLLPFESPRPALPAVPPPASHAPAAGRSSSTSADAWKVVLAAVLEDASQRTVDQPAPRAASSLGPQHQVNRHVLLTFPSPDGGSWIPKG